MRFDLVINIFAFMSTLYNEVKVFGDGRQWRPFLHVSDCARAFVHFTELPEPKHLLYNIANENLRVIDLIDVFTKINPNLKPKFLPVPDNDARNYRVSTHRMRADAFAPSVSVALGAEDIVDAIVKGQISDPESIFYRNAKWMKELTQFGDANHKEFVGLMETMAEVMPQRR